MRMGFKPRFDYGRSRPWVSQAGDALRVGAGPDALELRSDVPLRGHDFQQTAEFTVGPGQRVSFLLTAYPSWEAPPAPIEPGTAPDETEAWWREWSGRSTYRGGLAVGGGRSLITPQALTDAPTGRIVGPPTPSLPELLGGGRDWD